MTSTTHGPRPHHAGLPKWVHASRRPADYQGGMRCTKCGGNTRTIDSRPAEENTIRRRRCCEGCGWRFTTYEVIGSHPQSIQLAYLEEVKRLRDLADQLEACAGAITSGDSA